MKYIYPGDPEFSFENFSSLPYEYVLSAYEKGQKNQNRKQHMDEAPVSLLTSVFANSNRDPKKKRTPYKMDDFFLYQSKEDRNIPSAVFGSAAMELIKMKMFPKWALFAFKDLKESANGRPPSILAYIGVDIMILGPVIDDGQLRGMIICQESSYDTRRQLCSPCGAGLEVLVPRYSGKIYAEENVSIQILQSS